MDLETYFRENIHQPQSGVQNARCKLQMQALERPFHVALRHVTASNLLDQVKRRVVEDETNILLRWEIISLTWNFG